MNTTDKLSDPMPEASPAESLKFMMAPVHALALPEALFDRRQAIQEQPSIFFVPLIVWKNDDAFRIIDGCKRYELMAAQGRKECACGIIESPFDKTKAGLLRIALNSAREMGLAEKLVFVRWLKSGVGPEEYQAQLQKLKIAANEKHELELLLECGEKLVEAVIKGTLDRTVAPEMGHLKDGDIDAILAFFQAIPFSRQMQRELVEWLHEIAFMERTAIHELLASKGFSEILAQTKTNLPQKAAKFHEVAHARRFPLYAKAKRLWSENAGKTNPDPASVSFQSSPFFERRGLEVRIKLKDPETAPLLMKKMASIKTEEWRGLIDPTAFLSNDPD
jgi:hypothetical protein